MAAALFSFLFKKKKKCPPEIIKAEVTQDTQCAPRNVDTGLTKDTQCAPRNVDTGLTKDTQCAPRNVDTGLTKDTQCAPRNVDTGLTKDTQCAPRNVDTEETQSADETADTGLTQETRLRYYTAEFTSLGDITRDNHLRLEEFVRLMLLLGYPSDEAEAEKLWDSMDLPDGVYMTLDDYLALMSRGEVSSKTDTWRKLFAKFDTDGNGYASKAEVLQGLEEIGIDITPTIRGKIEGMDGNKDDKISYGEFLKEQLSQE